MPVTGRQAALKALSAYRQNGAFPDIVLDKMETSARDTALAKQILCGVLQNMALCDYYIEHFSARSLKKLEPRVLDILRISVYQILFLTKIPKSAAVSEGVALTKKYSNPRGAGFVNAVLRKIAESAQNDELPQIAAETELRRLSITYSHPEWLVREFINALGQGGAEELMSANNAADTPVTAQVNTLKASAADVLESLRADSVDAMPHEWIDGCIEMRRTGGVSRLSAFKKGYIYIQDIAARLSVTAAGIKPADFVIDTCAAPGGKSFAAAIMMENSGQIESCDIHEKKLNQITDGAARLGIDIITASHKDASAPSAEYAGKADAVLADVPCSGFGVLRKKAEIRYKPQQEIESLPDLQRRIISNVSTYVKPGGVLLYSTCTVFKRENEDVAEWFLKDNPDFLPESFILPGIGDVPGGMITLWPHIHGTDGFFICKLRRKL